MKKLVKKIKWNVVFAYVQLQVVSMWWFGWWLEGCGMKHCIPFFASIALCFYILLLEESRDDAKKKAKRRIARDKAMIRKMKEEE